MEELKILNIQNVSMSYGQEPLLTNLTQSFDSKNCYVIHGVSGVGKTTLAKIISGHLQPSSGQVLLNNKSVINTPGNHCLLVQQSNDLFPWIKTEKNLNQNNKDNVKILEALRINHLSNKYPYQLSGGEQKRLSIARAFSYSTDIIIIDEALSSVDSRQRGEIISSLNHLRKDNIVIFISHYPEDFKAIDATFIEM
ncbi:MAG: ATP-binding cassette domain-containing protein [Bacteriovoracaceae bacterium]|jgi:ABC-type multidrug transport system ATPase subunit|nr:ATP-binding cassette domain-containing protein [Bacteriovoracaceae bacterium]